jgi:hypothetical protein
MRAANGQRALHMMHMQHAPHDPGLHDSRASIQENLWPRRQHHAGHFERDAAT